MLVDYLEHLVLWYNYFKRAATEYRLSELAPSL